MKTLTAQAAGILGKETWSNMLYVYKMLFPGSVKRSRLSNDLSGFVEDFFTVLRNFCKTLHVISACSFCVWGLIYFSYVRAKRWKIQAPRNKVRITAIQVYNLFGELPLDNVLLWNKQRVFGNGDTGISKPKLEF